MSFQFQEIGLNGLILIEPDIYTDERGYFLETFKESDYEQAGICKRFVQDNHSFSNKNVIRGLHYQLPPAAQGKLVYLITGSILDIVVDIRKNSPDFGKWFSLELHSEKKQLLYIPEGFAHGFLTLTDNVHLMYRCTEKYSPENEKGILWNDPELNITWNITQPIISAKDAGLPYFKEAQIFE